MCLLSFSLLSFVLCCVCSVCSVLLFMRRSCYCFSFVFPQSAGQFFEILQGGNLVQDLSFARELDGPFSDIPVALYVLARLKIFHFHSIFHLITLMNRYGTHVQLGESVLYQYGGPSKDNSRNVCESLSVL